MKDFNLRAVDTAASDTLARPRESPQVVVTPTEYDLPESWRSLVDEAQAETAAEPDRSAAASPTALELPVTAPLPAPHPHEAVRSHGEPGRRAPRSAGTVAMVLGVIALAEAFAIGWLATRPASPVAATATVPVAIPVMIASASAGDTVLVDGRPAGVTPLQLTVDSGVREVRIAPAAPRPPVVAAPPVSRPQASAPPTAAPPPVRSGGIRLSSPIELQVLEGAQVLGSSADGPIVGPAGVHALDLVNSEFGYRERRLVEFKPGQILELTVTPPDGRLNVNAEPWAQVLIDGKESGETPLANVALTPGPHDVVFRHPQFGERRETVVIKPGALTRVSVTLSR